MAHILVFDSGLGGLTIWQGIRQRLPDISCHYLFDNAAFPYGELDEQTLLDRVCGLIEPLSRELDVDLVVIACNTASTLVLEPLRQLLRIPVVGVVPAIKPAAALSQIKHIGLLATPATVERPYTDRLIEQFARHCRVTRLGLSRLVTMAEQKLLGIPVDLDELASLLQPFRNGPDVVVLGCTHFPLLRAELQAVLASHVSLLDSASAIAERVAWWLREKTDSDGATQGNYYLHTAPLPHATALQRAMRSFNLEPCQEQERALLLPALSMAPVQQIINAKR